MRLLVHVFVIVFILIAVIDGNPTTDQVNPFGISSPDAASIQGTEETTVHDKSNERNLRSGKEDEERGILTNAKLELWLKLGYSPAKAYKKLNLPKNIADAYDLKNWEQMKQFYAMWLNKMAAQKPPTKA
ncbi:hypothetical protein P3T76_012279 [Phytophthora citrophthora]|uniref:RxLR effector protein n=1 Tax=Phytophthora citrophthora TaxID=4793 RepID=A0AAD9LDC9_9STRA|nr:hypothetical protein P3T76_012279 [Phytophthora citrophthora]